MNISQAKQIDIVDYLSRQDIQPAYKKYHKVWYCSPFRSENTPSFAVDPNRNEWWDYGKGEGGDLIDLCKLLYSTNDTSEVLRLIQSNAPTLVNNLVRSTNKPIKHQEESEMRNIRYIPLNHVALQSYLMKRKIDLLMAKTFCCEVHYQLRKREYFAIAFRNRIGGFEVRNQFFKGCIGHKDITFIPHAKDDMMKECCIFEGFMDFLSFLTMKERYGKFQDIPMECDFIVLNTICCLSRAMEILSHYAVIHCFLDNDEGGKRTTATICDKFPGKVSDEVIYYMNFKDLNDYLVKGL